MGTIKNQAALPSPCLFCSKRWNEPPLIQQEFLAAEVMLRTRHARAWISGSVPEQQAMKCFIFPLPVSWPQLHLISVSKCRVFPVISFCAAFKHDKS